MTLGRLGAGQHDQFGLTLTIPCARLTVLLNLAFNRRFNPFQNALLTHLLNRCRTDTNNISYRLVFVSTTRTMLVGSQQNLSP